MSNSTDIRVGLRDITDPPIDSLFPHFHSRYKTHLKYLIYKLVILYIGISKVRLTGPISLRAY